LAPEQALSNQVGMDPRTDVYQLGLILYELLTLRRAFPGVVMHEVLGRIKDGVFPAPRKQNPAVPRELEAIARMALELDAARRYPTARALREDLERYIEGDVPVAMRSDRWRAVSRSARYSLRRHPWRAGVAATCAVSVTAWAYARYHPAEEVTAQTTREAEEKTKHDLTDQITQDLMRSVAAEPLMSAFRLPPGASAPIPIHDGNPVQLNDSLGITISTHQPEYLYAFSVFRRGGNERYVAPMCAFTFEELNAPKKEAKESEAEELPPKPWGLKVPVGESNWVYSWLADEHNTFEGLIVFASPEERKDLATWLDRVHSLNKNRKEDGMLDSEALNELANPPVSRGKDPSLGTAEERKVRYHNVELGTNSKSEYLELPGLIRLKVECPLQTAK
jgi:hypothetical protein